VDAFDVCEVERGCAARTHFRKARLQNEPHSFARARAAIQVFHGPCLRHLPLNFSAQIAAG
jgi:hypothetical protein